jgi:hypothetical protein
MGLDLLRTYRHQRHCRILGAASPRYSHLGVSRRYRCFEPLLGSFLWRSGILDQYHQDLPHLWSDSLYFRDHGWRVSQSHTRPRAQLISSSNPLKDRYGFRFWRDPGVFAGTNFKEVITGIFDSVCWATFAYVTTTIFITI